MVTFFCMGDCSLPQYTYNWLEDYIFIDCEELNERVTSSALTQRSANFRREVKERDGEFCIITKELGFNCDAAHLISKSKGDEVTFIPLFYSIIHSFLVHPHSH